MATDQITVEAVTKGKSSIATVVIAFGVVMAVCFVAASMIQTILVSIILAIFLDPIVELLHRIHIPRPVGSLFAIVLLIAVVGLASVALYNRAEDFAQGLPRYSILIRQNILDVRRRVERLQKQTEQVIPRTEERVQTVTVSDTSLWSRYLFPGVQTAANFLLTVGFIPFLVYFMLSWKYHLGRSAVEAFSEADRPGVANGIREIGTAMRSYLVGNIVLGLILSSASMILFFALDLHYPVILGLISGFLTLIPYLGLLLAGIFPVLVALPQLHTLGPYLVMTGCLSAIHIIGINVLFPKIVGSRVNINPVAVTLALLIWGWMWGAMGLVLAIPITAGAKAVCDNFPGLKKFGRLLGD